MRIAATFPSDKSAVQTPGQKKIKLRSKEGQYAALGTGFLYFRADCGGVGLHKYCRRSSGNSKDPLLPISHSFPDYDGRPFVAPILKDRKQTYSQSDDCKVIRPEHSGSGETE